MIELQLWYRFLSDGVAFIHPVHGPGPVYSPEIIRVQDDALFQRNFQQLQVYYTDMRSALPPSELEPTIIGMNLLRLLVANRIAELHVELEMLSPETQAHPAIAFPRQLEQALMEGTYRQVLAASANSPSEYMQPLLQQLAATVRDELAACASAV